MLTHPQLRKALHPLNRQNRDRRHDAGPGTGGIAIPPVRATALEAEPAPCFFFSSRRRHTRSLCDWSSDVCSSDLELNSYLGVAIAACPDAEIVGHLEAIQHRLFDVGSDLCVLDEDKQKFKMPTFPDRKSVV